MFRKRDCVDPSLSFADCDEDQLYRLWKAYYPTESKPLFMKRQVCVLLENIAHLRGFDPSKWPDKFTKELNS